MIANHVLVARHVNQVQFLHKLVHKVLYVLLVQNSQSNIHVKQALLTTRQINNLVKIAHKVLIAQKELGRTYSVG